MRHVPEAWLRAGEPVWADGLICRPEGEVNRAQVAPPRDQGAPGAGLPGLAAARPTPAPSAWRRGPLASPTLLPRPLFPGPPPGGELAEASARYTPQTAPSRAPGGAGAPSAPAGRRWAGQPDLTPRALFHPSICIEGFPHRRLCPSVVTRGRQTRDKQLVTENRLNPG